MSHTTWRLCHEREIGGSMSHTTWRLCHEREIGGSMSHTLAFNRSSASPYCMLRSARVANTIRNVHTAGIPDISYLIFHTRYFTPDICH